MCQKSTTYKNTSITTNMDLQNFLIQSRMFIENHRLQYQKLKRFSDRSLARINYWMVGHTRQPVLFHYLYNNCLPIAPPCERRPITAER
jgi:hypothetical protein